MRGQHQKLEEVVGLLVRQSARFFTTIMWKKKKATTRADRRSAMLLVWSRSLREGTTRTLQFQLLYSRLAFVEPCSTQVRGNLGIGEVRFHRLAAISDARLALSKHHQSEY